MQVFCFDLSLPAFWTPETFCSADITHSSISSTTPTLLIFNLFIFSSRLLIRYTAQGKKIEMRRVEKYQQELSLPQTQTSQAKGRIGIPKHSGLDENHFHPLTFLAVLGSACFGTGPKNCSASTTAAPAASFPFRRTSNLSVGERVLPPHPLSHPPNPCYRYRRNGKIPRHPTPAGRQSARAEQKKIGGTCTGT